MSKNHFRSIIVVSLLISVFGSAYDHIWPDPMIDQAYEYIIELETDAEPEESAFIAVAAVGLVAGIAAIVSFVGLLLFKSWARHVYLAGFVAAFSLYPYIGLAVYSGVAQILYDLSMVLSGVILSLAYYSPVAEYFEEKI